MDEKIGVIIHKCQFENVQFICQPTVSVHLVDIRSGDNLIEECNDEVITKPYISFNSRKRPQSPTWEDTLHIPYNFCEIATKNASKLIFLFEIIDVLEQTTFSLKESKRDTVKGRLAWAFLKPVGSDESLNVSKQLRLQLYKIRKNCSSSHHSCPVFHLYSEHKRKKFPGTLYVTIKSVEAASFVKSPEAVTTNVHKGEASAHIQDSVEVPTIEITQWSRLPTQSCKLPNRKVADFTISQRGASCLSFSNSGLFLACGSFAKIVIVDVLTLKVTAKLCGHTGLVYELSWYSDDSLLLSLSADCSGMIWSVKPISNTPLYVLPHPSFVYCGKWFHDAFRVVTGGKDSILRYWTRNNEGFELLEEFHGHAGYVTAIETSGTSFICTGDSTGCVSLWNRLKGKWSLVRELSLKEIVGNVINAIHLHPGQRRIVVTARTRGSVMVDIQAGVVVQTYKAAHEAMRGTTCLTPCGSFLMTFSPGGNVNVWEFDSGKLVGTYDNIFPDLNHSLKELSGHIVYHPFEHMAAFAVLGCNCPVILLRYDRNNDMSIELGLLQFDSAKGQEAPTKAIDSKFESNVKKMSSDSLSSNQSTTGEKLAAIVRNIDRVLAAKKQMINHLESRSTFQNMS